MKLTAKMKMTGVAAATALSTASAFADIELNPNFSVSGYIGGDFKFTDSDGGDDDTTLDMAATKFAVKPKFDAVSGEVSVYATGDQDPVLLDAFFTYDLGGGTKITAGNFLSYLGYEAFHIDNLATLTYSNDVPQGWAAIPAYHTGIKIDHTADAVTVGVALVDSELNGAFYEGDGSLEDGIGLEAYATYTKDSLTLWGGLGYESYDSDETDFEFDYITLDFWAQYGLTETFTVAGEFCWTEYDEATTSNPEGLDTDAFFLAAYGFYDISDTTKLLGRISTGEQDEIEFVKFTAGAVFAVTPNLDVKAEATFTTYDGLGIDDAMLLGVRGIFKF